MLLRLTTFLLCQALGAALGGWRAGAWGALLGTCVGTWLWLGWDAWRGARVLAWLRRGDVAATPQLRGLWGELADRVRRRLRQSQQREQASQAQLHDILAALQASPNGVTLLDAQGRIEWCNRIAQEHFGFDAERDALQSIGNLVREPAFNAYCAARDFTHDVVLAGRHSTDSHPVRLSAQLHPYGEGRLLLLSRDITALEQAEAMRRDFVANVSHEIRTPLTVLVGFVETLQTLPLSDDERQRYLGLMAQQSTRMHNLVQDLVTLSRLEGSPLPDMHEWTGVAPLLARCEQEARALSHALNEAKGRAAQQIVFPAAEVLQSVGQLAGSPEELHSALANLINNAVRYTPAGGHIEVQWQPMAGGGARLAVIDSGPGLAPEHLPRITERFYRVDRSRSRDTGGTGLGLAIVKHVLQRHGAHLAISSVLGQGSVFAVEFPPGGVRALAVGEGP